MRRTYKPAAPLRQAMAPRIQPINLSTVRIQHVRNDFIRSAVLANAVQNHDRAAIPGRSGRPMAIKESSLIGRSDKSVTVGDLSRKMGYILRRTDLGRHRRL